MTKADALARLRAREADLRAMGIERLSIFGSTARGEERADSDVDLAAKLRRDMRIGLVEYLDLEERLAELLGAKVDLVSEPARKPRLRAQIDQDRVHVL
jgi:hypothetical protein